MTCPKEAELLEAYYALLGTGSAKIVRMALMIHRKHCPLCRPCYERSSWNCAPPKTITYRAKREGVGG